MPIDIICPGCHGRFQVSEKFAGKKGPCPKCKTILTIPKLEEQVKIHVPEAFAAGGKDAKGRPVLKPIARTDTKLQPNVAALIGAATVVTFGLAWMMGRAFSESGSPHIPGGLLAVGAIGLAWPLVMAGYSFLRDDELEPYRGKSLWIRSAICGLVYAALWGAYAWLNAQGIGSTGDVPVWVFEVPPLLAVGGLTAMGCLDFEFTSGVLHYSFYLLVTILLRMVMGLPAF